MIRPLALLAAIAALFPAGAGQAARARIAGIDHVPVAVGDLGAAAARFRQLGFALKPGRPHANGISNVHAKFPDGTEIELITAPAAVDPLTRTYRDHLAHGDGPAFLCLFARPADAVLDSVETAGFDAALESGLVSLAPGGPLPYLFFGQRQAAPTDRPEHFAHANGARSLRDVWLAGDDLSAERRLLVALGGRLRDTEVELPERTRAETVEFDDGSVVLLPGRYQRVPERKIVGMTVEVSQLDRTTAVLGAGQRRGRSLLLNPSESLGFWLEFRAPSRR